VVRYGAGYDLLAEETLLRENACSLKRGAAEQGDEADEAKPNGASQLIPGVGRTEARHE
jgi:hypothetical protein